MPPEKEAREMIEEILRCSSDIESQVVLLFDEADSVQDPQLRASVKEVSREAMDNRRVASDTILDVWNSSTEEVSLAALRELLQVMREFRKEVGVLRGIIRE